MFRIASSFAHAPTLAGAFSADAEANGMPHAVQALCLMEPTVTADRAQRDGKIFTTGGNYLHLKLP
jgi:hypothetical protein